MLGHAHGTAALIVKYGTLVGWCHFSMAAPTPMLFPYSRSRGASCQGARLSNPRPKQPPPHPSVRTLACIIPQAADGPI
jgi:hypothetical protein